MMVFKLTKIQQEHYIEIKECPVRDGAKNLTQINQWFRRPKKIKLRTYKKYKMSKKTEKPKKNKNVAYLSAKKMYVYTRENKSHWILNDEILHYI